MTIFGENILYSVDYDVSFVTFLEFTLPSHGKPVEQTDYLDAGTSKHNS